MINSTLGRTRSSSLKKALLGMIGAGAATALVTPASAQLYSVHADGNTNGILEIDLGAATVAESGCSNSDGSAGNAVVGEMHYSENINTTFQIMRVDLDTCALTIFNRDYTPNGTGQANNKLAVDASGNIYEIDRSGKLWELSFDEGSGTVSRSLTKDFGQTFGGGGDFAWGPDGKLYIASNESAVGNYVYDADTDTLTSLGSGGGANNYQGIVWFEGSLYGVTASDSSTSATATVHRLDPTTMASAEMIVSTSEFGRLNDLAAWPIDITVRINVHPFSDPNPLNLKSGGTTPVAILGSEFLDVSDINIGTLAFGGSNVKVTGKAAKELCSVDDIGSYDPASFDDLGAPDGYPDLVCHFVTDEIMPVADGEMYVVTITGELNDGTPFEASDIVKIVSW